VMQAVAALGTPQQPGRPKRGEQFRFAFVLPADASPFVDLIDRQIAQAAGDFRHQHITEITQRFSLTDPDAFANGLEQLEDCDGLVVLAPDVPAVKLAINNKVRAGAHVVTLFSDVAGSMRQAYVGVDNRAAGRTAGLLLGRMAGAQSQDTLLLLSQATRLSAEIERRIGFAQVIEERFSDLRLQRGPDLPTDDAGVYSLLADYLRNEMNADRIGGIYCVGTGSGGVVRALADIGLTHALGVAAHDATDAHQRMLSNGELAYVLNQDIHYCVLAAARVLRGLCDNVRGAPSVVPPRVEILTAENLH
jgi:LacI family transcriptional regulator